MLDLHIHTIYSDGMYSVNEILEMAEKLHLSIISITDHDCCKAYYDLEDEKIRQKFTGQIKTGIEITTEFDGVKIELLAYDFMDYKIINDFFITATNNIDWEPILIYERLILLNKLNDLSIKFDTSFYEKLLGDRFESKLYGTILRLNKVENLKNILKDYYCESGPEFY